MRRKQEEDEECVKLECYQIMRSLNKIKNAMIRIIKVFVIV